jgi:pyruvate dehydrogenase E1 component alpha subunit
MTMAKFDKEQLLNWYYQMVLIRQFEDRSKELFHQKKIGGVYLHLYNGQEAAGVGAVHALRPDDHVITAYRDHGIAIARGLDPRRIMAEMFGKRTGVSGGKGGSMHLASREHNFWGGWAIVGAHLSLAAGLAMEPWYRSKDQVVLCFLGDGATNNGYFHESLNFSAVLKLPVIWLIENNLYGMGTSVEDASGQPVLVKRAGSYGIKEGPRVDGQDVMAVYSAVSEAAQFARKNGPILIEALTFRYEGHGMSDKMFDKRAEELAFWKENDPIIRLRNYLCDKFKEIEPELAKLDAKAGEVVEEAVQFAEESPVPTYEDLINHINVAD